MASNAVNAILFKVIDLLQRLRVSWLLHGHLREAAVTSLQRYPPAKSKRRSFEEPHSSHLYNSGFPSC
jgi:hypothetical protein